MLKISEKNFRMLWSLFMKKQTNFWYLSKKFVGFYLQDFINCKNKSCQGYDGLIKKKRSTFRGKSKINKQQMKITFI